MTVAELQRFLDEHFPQIAHMRLRLDSVDARRIRLAMQAGEAHLRPGDTVSGPTLMALADTAIYLLLLAQIGPVALAVTTNLTINFLRKAPAGEVRAEGRLLKLGQRLAVGEVTMYGAGADEPAAHATLTYSIPPR